MRCVECGERRFEEKRKTETIEAAGLTFAAEVPVDVCAKCRHEYLHGPAMVEFERRVAVELARRGAPLPETFRRLRKALGLRAVDLGAMLEVRPETISRWENGQTEVDWPSYLLTWWMVEEALEGRSDTMDKLKAPRPAVPPSARAKAIKVTLAPKSRRSA
jgi:putative zinc finger/helix-turn-helix YgiT family protein